MKFNIQSPHFSIPERTTRMLVKKFERLEKILDQIDRYDIVLKKEKNSKQENFIVDVKLIVPGNDLFASARAESFAAATEKVFVDLRTQIKKLKSKMYRKAKFPVDHFIQSE